MGNGYSPLRDTTEDGAAVGRTASAGAGRSSIVSANPGSESNGYRHVKIKGIHHVAFAHDSGEVVVNALTSILGLEVEHVEDGDGFTERMIPAGPCYVQTLEATGPGVVAKFIGKRGSSLHHIAFEVSDIDGAMADLVERGVDLIDTRPRPGGMGTRIAFAHPRSFGGLLVELVEVPEETAG